MNNRYKRILSGSLGSYFGVFSIAIFQLASVPIFIEYLGKDGYSSWILFYSIPAMLMLLEFGIFAVISNEISNGISSKNKKFVSHLIFQTYRFFGVVFFISIFFASLFVLISDKSLTYVYVIFYALLILMTNLQTALYRAIYKFHVGNWISVGVKSIESFGAIAVVMSGGGIADIFLLFIVLRIVVVLYSYLKLAKEYSDIGIQIVKNKEQLKNLSVIRSKIKQFAVYPIILIINNQVLLWIVAYKFGNEYLIILTTVRTLFRFQNQIVRAVTSSSWQEFTELYNKNNYLEMYSLVSKVQCFAFVVCSVYLLVMFIFGDDIYMAWTGGGISINSIDFIVLGLSVSINTLWLPIHTFFVSRGKYNLHLKPILVVHIMLFAYFFFYFHDFTYVALCLLVIEFLALCICVIFYFYEKLSYK